MTQVFGTDRTGSDRRNTPLVLTTCRDITDVLGSDDFLPDNTHPRTPLFAGSLVTLDGGSHRGRRRVETPLIGRSSLQTYPNFDLPGALGTADPSTLERCGSKIRVDLVPLVRRMMYRFAAHITGIDLAEGSVERFIDLQERMGAGAAVAYESSDRDTRVAEALALRETFRREFLDPSLRRRSTPGGGRFTAATSPDLLSLLLAAGLPDAALPEAVLYFLASTGTTARVIPHAIAEIGAWVTEDAGRWREVTRPGFLDLVAGEALRLHPPTPSIYRRVVRAHRLPRGDTVAPGALLHLDVRSANREHEVWGDDAGRFDPLRVTPPGQRPWGLAFGAGPHQCIGLPAAVGLRATRSGQPVDGLIARVLGPLYKANVEPDPDREPLLHTVGHFEAYVTFPVLLENSALGVG